jgi:PAS domain S-box-containing protein
VDEQRDDEKLLSLLESSDDALYIRNLKTDSYEYMSPGIEHITGFTAAEMKSMKVVEVIERVHPDDRDTVRGVLDRVRTGGKGIVEYRLKGRDGRYRMCPINPYPYHQQGEPAFRIGIVRDISERIQMEESLRRSEIGTAHWLRCLPTRFSSISEPGRVREPRCVAAFGAYSPDQLVARRRSTIHPQYLEIIQGADRASACRRKCPLIEEIIVRMVGSAVDVEVAAAPFMTDEGMANQVILRDITERKWAEEACLTEETA